VLFKTYIATVYYLYFAILSVE